MKLRLSIASPVRLIPVLFLLAILLGTIALSLPFARAGEGAAPPLVALFTAQAFDKAPIRTYGTLAREDDGTLVFDYKPWLVMPVRRVKLAPSDYAVGRGLFLRRVLRTADNDESEEVFTLPPRYREHEDAVTQIYHLGPEREIGLLRAIMSIWRCVKWLVGMGKPTSVPVTV